MKRTNGALDTVKLCCFRQYTILYSMYAAGGGGWWVTGGLIIVDRCTCATIHHLAFSSPPVRTFVTGIFKNDIIILK